MGLVDLVAVPGRRGRRQHRRQRLTGQRRGREQPLGQPDQPPRPTPPTPHQISHRRSRMNTTLGEPTTGLHAGDDPDVAVVELTTQHPIGLQLLEQFTVGGGSFRHTQPSQRRRNLTAGDTQLRLGHVPIMPARTDNFPTIYEGGSNTFNLSTRVAVNGHSAILSCGSDKKLRPPVRRERIRRRTYPTPVPDRQPGPQPPEPLPAASRPQQPPNPDRTPDTGNTTRPDPVRGALTPATPKRTPGTEIPAHPTLGAVTRGNVDSPSVHGIRSSKPEPRERTPRPSKSLGDRRVDVVR